MIVLDWTLVAAGMIFLVTLVALNSLLFKPLAATLRERQAQTSDLEEGAKRKFGEQAVLAEKYSARIRKARRRGYEIAEEAHREALSQRQDAISQARGRAEELLLQARQQIDEEVRLAEEGIRQEVEEIAGAIAGQVLKEA